MQCWEYDSYLFCFPVPSDIPRDIPCIACDHCDHFQVWWLFSYESARCGKLQRWGLGSIYVYLYDTFISSLKLTFMHLKMGGLEDEVAFFLGVMLVSGRVIGTYVFIDRTDATRVQWRNNKNDQSKRSDKVLMFLLSFCRMYSSLSRWWFQRFLELLPQKLVEMIRFQFDKTTIFLFDLG